MTKPDPKAMYIVLENHVNDFGIFKAGDRVRGDHPDVKKHLDMLYVAEGLTTEETHLIHQSRFPGSRI
jgi:hypothetical protein